MKQLRNFYQLFLLISLSISFVGIGLKTVAQNQTIDSVLNEKNKPYPKREVGFSIGIFPLAGVLSPDAGLSFGDPGVHVYYIEKSNGNYEKMYCIGSYTFNYNYHFNQKNSIGISLSWVGKHIETYWIYPADRANLTTDTVDGCGWRHYFTLMGNYRHTYHRKNKLSLYWGFYLGATLCIRDKDILPKEVRHHFIGSTNNDRYYFAPAIQLNAFGLEIGGKNIFNIELGIGTQGLFKVGFKYKY
jgi:hypothetical protein